MIISGFDASFFFTCDPLATFSAATPNFSFSSSGGGTPVKKKVVTSYLVFGLHPSRTAIKTAGMTMLMNNLFSFNTKPFLFCQAATDAFMVPEGLEHLFPPLEFPTTEEVVHLDIAQILQQGHRYPFPGVVFIAFSTG